MYSNVLIATDLSRDSDELVCCASGLSRAGCRSAHLVYALEIEETGVLRQDIMQLVDKELERQKAVLQKAGIETTCHVAMTPVQKEIDRIAGEHGCTLLVVGSRVHSLAGEILFGGVAASVLSGVARPLLMIRLNRTENDETQSCGTWPCFPMKHLLYPTDFSDNAGHVFEYLRQFVRDIEPERITLMHVQDQRRIDPHLKHKLDEFNVTDRDRLEKLRDRLLEAGSLTVDIEMPYGHPAVEIIEFSRRESVSLITMGSQGRGRVSELFTGSVSHNVARQAPVPTLLVPL